MLNRVKKNLIIAAIAGTMCLTLPSFAIDSTISYVDINDLAYQDVEIVLDNNKILVPFKQLADVFEIKYTADRATKQIGFVTYDGKQGVINQNGVFVNDVPIWSEKPVFVASGIIEGVFNEAYLPAEIVSEIMGIQLDTDYENLVLNAKCDRDIAIIRNANPYEVEDDKSPKAYQDVITPKKSGPITLKTLGLRDNLQNDRTHMRYSSTDFGLTTFSNLFTQSIQGDFFGGKYRIEANEYSYKHEGFRFAGLTATYRNKFGAYEPSSGKKNEYYYELGKVRGISDKDAQMGTQIFGAQVWNYDNERVSPSKISGYVKPTSLVRLTVNDLEPVTLSTYAGYYNLKDVQLPNPVRKIKLEEINEDGTVELISEEKYSIYGNGVPLEHEMLKTAYAGVWGYQNRLFRDGANIYRGTNKKVTGGAEI